jgi:2-methylcitrate dehydratase
MTSLKSGMAPPISGTREYDPEIKDIASYVHNTPIDSELAVGTTLAHVSIRSHMANIYL